MSTVFSGSSRSAFAAALSDAPTARQAIEEATRLVSNQLDQEPTWVCLFVSAAWRDELESIVQHVIPTLGTDNVVGCTAESLIGTQRELEDQPGLCLWAAKFQERPACFALDFVTTPDGGSCVGWPEWWITGASKTGTLVILADPFSFPADYMLEALFDEHPKLKAVGGMASGAMAPGECRLVLGGSILDRGAVVTWLPPSIAVRHVVAQGCRPVGRSFVITRAERNVVYELGGRPALEQLYRTFTELPNHEQQLMQQAVHLGRVVDEHQAQFGLGDFLIRNVIGADRQTGALFVADYLRVGQTVQFHIRDENTADSELRELLARVAQPPPHAGLLFSCNGRGTRLFSVPNHDAIAVADCLGQIPLAGFFAQGEIGPIGHRNFVHGFTASLILFE